MALFFLDYDLHKKDEFDYDKLYTLLGEFNAVRVLESCWCFNRINTNAEGLRDFFRTYLHKDDRFCVTEVSDWATYNTLASPADLH